MLGKSPWFCASDVASLFGMTRSNSVIRSLAAENITELLQPTNAGPRLCKFISEAGLYLVMLRSRTPGCARFVDWVTKDVLPSIRRDGEYTSPSVDAPAKRHEHTPATAPARPIPQTFAQALRALADETEAREQAERDRDAADARTLAILPAAAAWSDLAQSGANYSLRQSAAILSQAGIKTGQNRLLAKLVDLSILDSNRQPYAHHYQRVVLRPRTYVHPHTGERKAAAPQVRITARGIAYVYMRLGGVGPIGILPPPNDTSPGTVDHRQIAESDDIGGPVRARVMVLEQALAHASESDAPDHVRAVSIAAIEDQLADARADLEALEWEALECSDKVSV